MLPGSGRLMTAAGFGEFKDEAEVAFWTGTLGTSFIYSIDGGNSSCSLVSTFFLTQFLTSLLWVRHSANVNEFPLIILS